tara:strand:- start:489 stop:1190 length:702 start_codon:yes stop_codon:yes gene_type:complete
MKYTHTKPRAWSDEDVQFLKDGLEKGLSLAEIAKQLNRTETAIGIKRKRLSKQNRTYNYKHVDEKYDANLRYLQKVKAKSVLDLYAGPRSFYRGIVEKLVSNDLRYDGHDYKDEAKYVLAKIYAKRERYDVVDLDPFGSAFECLELAVQVAKKGLIVTFGELGHRRWKRNDYIKRTYRIYDIERLNLITLAAYVDEVAMRYKKRAVTCMSYDWNNIGRIYFELQDLPKQPPRI